MATTTAITAATAAGVSSAIAVADGSSITVWAGSVLGAGESVRGFLTDGGSNQVLVIEKSGATAEIAGGASCVKLNGPGSFIVKKSATKISTAVFYES